MPATPKMLENVFMSSTSQWHLAFVDRMAGGLRGGLQSLYMHRGRRPLKRGQSAKSRNAMMCLALTSSQSVALSLDNQQRLTI
jgi:hypothetical protein